MNTEKGLLKILLKQTVRPGMHTYKVVKITYTFCKNMRHAVEKYFHCCDEFSKDNIL